MFIKYDEYELLELFESEPIAISDKEAGMFIYTKTDKNSVKIVLSISVYERECILSLSLKERLLFEIQLNRVEYLASENKCLRIHQSNSTHEHLIHFEPSIFIKADIK